MLRRKSGAEPESDMAGDTTRQIRAIRDRKLFRIAVGGSQHEDDAVPLGNGYGSEIHRCNGMPRDLLSNPGAAERSSIALGIGGESGSACCL
jgi:hypothetical protein